MIMNKHQFWYWALSRFKTCGFRRTLNMHRLQVVFGYFIFEPMEADSEYESDEW